MPAPRQETTSEPDLRQMAPAVNPAAITIVRGYKHRSHGMN